MTTDKSNTVQRIVYGARGGSGRQRVPELIEIGWGRFAEADYGHLGVHQHAGAYEICLILAGEVEWQTQTATYVLRAGDVFVTRPGELHWGKDSVMHPCTLYWMIIGAPHQGYSWTGLDRKIEALIDRRLLNIETNRFRGSPSLRDAMAALFAEHEECGEETDDPLGIASVRANLHRLLIDLARLAAPSAAAPVGNSRLHGPIVELLTRLKDDPAADFDLRAFCAAHHLSQRKLNRAFADSVGSSIAQFWIRQRVRLARDRLSDSSDTVTDIALTLGFSSSQHFATSFRKITGLTPSEYRSASRRDDRARM